MLSDAGLLPEGQSLYDPESTTMVHHVTQALRAHKLFTKDQQYIVRDGEVMLIDEFTGRMMRGRRLSDGLHQAIEAKEGVAIQPENVTLASVTFQNYFRLYEKLGGMTGTASTEADEFMEIYGLGVVEVPTNRPLRAKMNMTGLPHRARKIRRHREDDQGGAPPRASRLLVGTTSIEKSEFLSEMLKEAGIPHNVLNARQHEQEAQIVADAGKFGAVTIATNMAGRGTDIQLGGNVEMKVMQAIAADPHLHPDEVRARIEAEHADEKAQVIAAGGLVSFWRPNVTKAAASTTSCAGGRAVRATPGGLRSSCPGRRSDADFRVGTAGQGAVDAGHERRRGDCSPMGQQSRWKTRRPRSKAATLTSASNC